MSQNDPEQTSLYFEPRKRIAQVRFATLMTRPRFQPLDEGGLRAMRLRGRPFCPSRAIRLARSESAPLGSVSRGLRAISVKRVVPSLRSTVPLPDRASDTKSNLEACATARNVNMKHVSTAAGRRCSGLHTSPGPSKSFGGADRNGETLRRRERRITPWARQKERPRTDVAMASCSPYSSNWWTRRDDLLSAIHVSAIALRLQVGDSRLMTASGIYQRPGD
jgi:hypothetical protein